MRFLKDQDKQAAEEKYESSKKQIIELIDTFKQKGYYQGAMYLENLSRRIFTNIGHISRFLCSSA